MVTFQNPLKKYAEAISQNKTKRWYAYAVVLAAQTAVTLFLLFMFNVSPSLVDQIMPVIAIIAIVIVFLFGISFYYWNTRIGKIFLVISILYIVIDGSANSDTFGVILHLALLVIGYKYAKSKFPVSNQRNDKMDLKVKRNE